MKPWESIIVSENLSWSDFLKINNFLYDLVGVKPVMTISRNYPFSDVYTHILGYVSQPNEEEILDIEEIDALHNDLIMQLKNIYDAKQGLVLNLSLIQNHGFYIHEFQ